ncbi:hypothetical protein B296_00055565, partial [Ensete ventricosum]
RKRSSEPPPGEAHRCRPPFPLPCRPWLAADATMHGDDSGGGWRCCQRGPHRSKRKDRESCRNKFRGGARYEEGLPSMRGDRHACMQLVHVTRCMRTSARSPAALHHTLPAGVRPDVNSSSLSASSVIRGDEVLTQSGHRIPIPTITRLHDPTSIDVGATTTETEMRCHRKTCLQVYHMTSRTNDLRFQLCSEHVSYTVWGRRLVMYKRKVVRFFALHSPMERWPSSPTQEGKKRQLQGELEWPAFPGEGRRECSLVTRLD